MPGDTFAERYGITLQEVRAYERAHGVRGVASMFNRQRRSAWDRGIGWEISLREWMEVWGDNIGRRGQGSDKLMMCRKDDKGPYRKDNVRMATPHENSTDAHVARRIANWGSKHGGSPTGY